MWTGRSGRHGGKKISVGVCFPQREHPGQREQDGAQRRLTKQRVVRDRQGGSLGPD